MRGLELTEDFRQGCFFFPISLSLFYFLLGQNVPNEKYQFSSICFPSSFPSISRSSNNLSPPPLSATSMAEETSSILSIVFLSLLMAMISIRPSTAFSDDHMYEVGDHVPLFANKVGPLFSPSVTYQYFDMPFCRPVHIIHKKETLGEILNGDRLTNCLYQLEFREDKIMETLCQKTFSREEVAKFRDAVKNDFYFQMSYDDLPFWGYIGKIEQQTWIASQTNPRYYLFKHVQFDILYNENQVIEIRSLGDPNHSIDITEDEEVIIQFTYSVFWNKTSSQFMKRMERYSRFSLLPEHLKIHWFSIINSVVIVFLLLGLLSTLLMRSLRNDLMKYSNEDEEADKEEVGWKHLHGDVFRYPPYPSLFCAVLGAGTQLLILVVCVFVSAFLGIIFPYNRGALSTSLVLIYSLTSVVAGYYAASMRVKLAGTGGEVGRSVLLTGVLYIGPLFLTFSFLNTVAISYRATAALPFGTIVVIFLIWIVITIPLLAVGGMIGHVFKSDFQAPCATRRTPLEIPSLDWYRKTPAQMFLGGLLPFSAIFIELNYIYASLWGHKIYVVYGILFVMFIILIIITAILSIGLTYLQLSVEDHGWWWRSMLRGGSTAIFMYGYCIYFYARSNMSGFMQLAFFFGYNACICYAFFLMLATIGFHASLLFVRRIYRTVKLE